MDNNKIAKIVGAAATAAATAIGEGTRRALRRNGQKKIQERVNASMPAQVKKDLSVEDKNIQLTILDNNSVNLEQCQESPMSENEINEWKSLISTLGGETAKAALTDFSFNGLLKCDVPLNDLCRVKGDPEAIRGLVMNDGRISKQASFKEVGIGRVAPLLVFQCMAAVTSQYYQNIITESLNTIDMKLDNIIKILEADDYGKLKHAYNCIIELKDKSQYNNDHLKRASETSDNVDIILEKYRKLLLGIKDLNVSYKWSDKEEAEQKLKALKDSQYFYYLEMVMRADALYFIASALSSKIAKCLGNEEDAMIYLKRLNLDYWDNYVNQFNIIKHDVIKYLELEADASWFQGNSISAMKDEQLNKFNAIEEAMLRLKKQFECRAVQYLKVEEDGTMKKYIEIRKE